VGVTQARAADKWVESRSEGMQVTHHGRDQIATVRVGATHGPFLFYVKGGVAGGEITAKSWDPQPHWSEVTHRTGGWVLGTGFELFLHRNITWGIEYDFVGLEAKTFNGAVNFSSSVPVAPLFQNTVIDSDIRLVMTRLNFKFGP